MSRFHLKKYSTKMKRCNMFKIIVIILSACLLLGVSIFTVAGLTPITTERMGENHSCYVQMHDGTRLAVRYILPDDWSKKDKIPAVMETTRYGTQSNPSFLLKALVNLKIAHEVKPAILEKLLHAGFAYVAVDARGSGASFGTRETEWSKQEITDMDQVISWITRQNWSDGKVGTYGISYSGNTAEEALAAKNPALFAAAPLYPDFDLMRQIVMPGGIHNIVLSKKWGKEVAALDSNQKSLFSDGFTHVDKDQDGKLLRQAVKGHHTINIDQALQKIVSLDDHLTASYTAEMMSPYYDKEAIQKSGRPLYVRVGWMDAGTVNGAIARFLTYSNDQTLVIGPWGHGGLSFYDPFLKKQYTRKELDMTQAQELVSFYEKALKKSMEEKSASNHSARKLIRYYTMGEGKWKTTKAWPVVGTKTQKWYFQNGNGLTPRKPETITGKDRYAVDFTAETGSSNRWFTNIGGGHIFYSDRAEADKKLLCYTSQPIKTDTELTGTPVATLSISSSNQDGALFVYLEDVAPDGKVTYITEGELRLLHRKETMQGEIGYTFTGAEHSYLKKDEKLMQPGKTETIKIGMYATSVLIRKGHRIRIAVAGNDRATFERIPGQGKTDLTIQHNRTQFSFVELPFVMLQ